MSALQIFLQPGFRIDEVCLVRKMSQSIGKYVQHDISCGCIPAVQKNCANDRLESIGQNGCSLVATGASFSAAHFDMRAELDFSRDLSQCLPPDEIGPTEAESLAHERTGH